MIGIYWINFAHWWVSRFFAGVPESQACLFYENKKVIDVTDSMSNFSELWRFHTKLSILPALYISESCIKIKIHLNFYFLKFLF